VRTAFDNGLISSDGELLLLREAVYLHELTDGFKVERVSDGGRIDDYNTERPHSALAGWTPYGAG
jgi:hypothetical protein